jgi:hypothetical protein
VVGIEVGGAQAIARVAAALRIRYRNFAGAIDSQRAMNALHATADETDEAAGAWDVESLHFAPRIDAPPGWRLQQVAIGLGVVALHLVFWWVIEAQSRNRTPQAANDEAAIAVTYIATMPPQLIRAGRPPTPTPTLPTRAVATPRVRTAERRIRHADPTRDARLQLYLPDGSLRLPEGLLDDIDPIADERDFAFKMPDLGKAARLLDRPPALVYESTRFDEYWEPQQDLVTAVLRKAVEKTTKEVRIPIPGARGRFLVCRVSLLAAGGACGMERNGGNAVVSLDDPATLSPVEAAACAAWWERIEGATTQDEWRATRRLYESECRKPLAQAPPEAKPAPVH